MSKKYWCPVCSEKQVSKENKLCQECAENDYYEREIAHTVSE